MKFSHIFFISYAFFTLSSCVTQSPAPIEHGSESSAKSSASEVGYYDAAIEEKGSVKEFWGGEEIQEKKNNIDIIEEEKDQKSLGYKTDPSIPIRTNDITHEVIEGETLEYIAQKYGVSKELIIAKNNLAAPYKLEELQILKIPPQNEISVEIGDIVTSNKAVVDTIANTASSIRMPVEGKILTKFGENYQGSVNQGVNIAAPMGSEVQAVESGIVMHSGFDTKFGNLVIIKSNEGDIFTAYAHMNDLNLTNGEAISVGQVIGHVGQTGKVTSPQLHFAVRKGKIPIDPVAYLNGNT